MFLYWLLLDFFQFRCFPEILGKSRNPRRPSFDNHDVMTTHQAGWVGERGGKLTYRVFNLVPFCQIIQDACRSSSMVAAPRLWNSLPLNIRSTTSRSYVYNLTKNILIQVSFFHNALNNLFISICLIICFYF